MKLTNVNEVLTFAIRKEADAAAFYRMAADRSTPGLKKAFEAYETLEVGGVIVNDVPTFRIDHMPYGGMKQSGTGREGIRACLRSPSRARAWGSGTPRWSPS